MLDGERTRDEAIEDDARRNVAFAKRQRTWFRGDSGIAWLDATRDISRPARAVIEGRPGILSAP